MIMFLGLLFGAVGGIYLFLARREHDVMYLVAGVLLIFYPYFFSNLFLVLAIGIVLCALPVAHARGWF